MAKIRGDYVDLGRAAFAEVGHKQSDGRDDGIPCEWKGLSVAMSGSWQAVAFREGWNNAKQKEADDVRRRAAQAEAIAAPVQSIANLAEAKRHTGVKLGAGRMFVDGLEIGTVTSAYVKPTINAAEQRRADRIDKMTRGYIAAALWSTGGLEDPETGEDLDNLDNFEFSDEAKSDAWKYCAEFYDRYTTDLGAYAGTYKPSGGHDVWECAGHDLWLTAGGHGVGFWDRGLGRLGDRLSKACGWRTAFPEQDLYIGDDGFVHFS
jgi:hypothetical protein